MVMFSRSLRNLSALTLAAALFTYGQAVQADPPPRSVPHSKVKTSDKTALDSVLQDAIKNAPTAGQWPNSSYARLLDLGAVTVRSDGTTISRFRITYKLFNQNARDLAEVHLPYNASYQDLHVVSARTIKKDGTVVNVDPNDIRTGGLAGDYLMYDDAMAANFSMPGVEDDCVIDYTWEEVTHPTLMPGQFMTYWGFSDAIPVSVSRYTLKAPADKQLKYKEYNAPGLKPVITTSVDGRFKTYTWELKDIKPIELEPSMPPVSEVRSWIEVSSINAWQDIAQWFHALQQPQARSNEAIKNTVDSLIANKKTDDDKARAIYDWVTGKTRYVGLEFGISAYKPHSAADVFHNLYGDCKDKANLLITMLGLAGIKAHPVLLHAEDRTVVADRLPTLSAFNHCIALADISGKDVWLDATAETCAYGDIPSGDRGVQALVVTDSSGEFKTIPTYQPNESGLDINVAITPLPNGGARTDTVATLNGELAQMMRASARMITPDKRKEVARKMAERFGLMGDVKDFNLPDGVEKEGAYQMKVSLEMPSYGKKTGSLLLLPLFTGLNSSVSGERSNPYTSEGRIWPIVSDDNSHLHSQTTLALPDGYQIEEVPDDVNLTSPLEEYHRKLVRSADGKSITITESFEDRAGKVLPADYSKVKSFWTDLIKTTDDQIVLKKAP